MRLSCCLTLRPGLTTFVVSLLRVATCDAMQDALHGFVEPFWIVVEDSDSEYVLHHEFFLLKKQFMEDDHTVAFTVPISEPLPPQYFIKVGQSSCLLCPPAHLL